MLALGTKDRMKYISIESICEPQRWVDLPSPSLRLSTLDGTRIGSNSNEPTLTNVPLWAPLWDIESTCRDILFSTPVKRWGDSQPGSSTAFASTGAIESHPEVLGHPLI